EDGAVRAEITALAPAGDRRMSANPHTNGGLLARELELPDLRDYAVDVDSPATTSSEATRVLGARLRDVVREMLTAVRHAANGEEYVSPRVAAGLEAVRRAIDGDGLSPRETEVLRLTALVHTSVEIAAKPALSRRTVETHRARIHRKLGLTTRAQLVQFALRRGLIGA
ncbi:MAG: LuxR C-terminal-related transcriptional regulator, partial [Solirubrobacteraceae bacterium]